MPIDVVKVGRDPRAEKLKDFRRHAGKCPNARCGICHPDKRWHRKAHRIARNVIAALRDETNEDQVSS